MLSICLKLRTFLGSERNKTANGLKINFFLSVIVPPVTN